MTGKNQPARFMWVGLMIVFGAGAGLIIGILLDNLALWPVAGAGIGVVVGAAIESQRP